MNAASRSTPFLRRRVACLILSLAIIPAFFTSTPARDSTAAAADTAHAPLAVTLDNSDITPVPVPEEELADFRDDSEFNYVQEATPEGESFLSRILRAIDEFIFDLMPDDGASSVWDLLTMIGLAIAVVVVVIMISGIRTSFLRPTARLTSDMKEIDENIHEMDFDTLITEAVGAGRYRRAVRLLYLRSLKRMTDRGVIEWRLDRTNHEYIRQLGASAPQILPPFRDATLAFEYVWYGDLGVDSTRFERIWRTFEGLDDTIRQAPARVAVTAATNQHQRTS